MELPFAESGPDFPKVPDRKMWSRCNLQNKVACSLHFNAGVGRRAQKGTLGADLIVMSTASFVSSIRLVPELLSIPTRIRLPANHQTRMTENALEFTAEVPTEIEAAEEERLDFLYAIVESGRAPTPIKGFNMEISGYAANAWLKSLDPFHTSSRELAYVKYTPRVGVTSSLDQAPVRPVQAA